MKTPKLITCIALLAIGITACTMEDDPVKTLKDAEPCQISCTMSATMPEFKVGGDLETKSSLESVVRVKWKKDDELSVINLTTGKQLGGCIKADNDGANTTFSPSGLVGSITAGDKLVFLLDNDPGRRSVTEKDFESFTMDFSSQKGNSNEVPIVVYADYTATQDGTINAVNPEFNFLMGYVQLAVSALPASTSVTELGIENLNTMCQFSISNHEFVTTPQNGNITLSEAFTANSKGANTRYFSCFTSPAQGVARNAHINANSINHITAWLKAALSAGYYYQSVATGFTNENISFVDGTFKSYCVSHYDKNGDGEISFAEAAAVTSFAAFTAAEKSSLQEVYELPYFFKGERIPDFEDCTALRQITLPGTLQAIQANAFKGCTALEEITIPSNVTTIGEGAFEGCTSLERFNGTLASADRRYLVKNNHVLAFAPAGLTETTIPDGVTTINAGVFANNTTVKTVYLSAALTTVEARAFKGCTALPIIRFRSQIASIGEEAFNGCSTLRSVYCDAVTPPSVGTDAFANCHASLAAHVTVGNLSAYEADPSWSALNVTTGQPWNEIWYTTTDGNVLDRDFYLSVNLVSNSYVDGKGILSFDGDVTAINDALGTNLENFYSCTSLETITLSEGLQSIGAHAFQNCTALTSITLPNGLQSIGEYAFCGCESLETISIPEGVTSINEWTFFACNKLTSVFLSEGLQSIGDYAFSGCSFDSITIPNSVQSIGEQAFGSCGNLESITLPNSLQSISNGTFYFCTSLESITLPNSLQSIGAHVFRNCTSLGSITLPNGLQSIGEQAFHTCSSLTTITIPEGVTSIGEFTFNYCTALTSITLPSSLQSIGNSAFESCRLLESIVIPNGVESIGNRAFSDCLSLETITLPEGLLSIGDLAFGACYSLGSLTLPSTIVSLGNSMFSAASSLETLYIKAITPPSGTPNNDIGYGSLYIQHIKVPTSSVDAYKAAWLDLAGIIEGHTF